MILKTKFIESKDLKRINNWLVGWKLNKLPLGMYPTTGLILYNEEDGEGIYSGFVFMSNSQMAQVGFITRNPYYKKKIKPNVRKEFIVCLVDYAKELGYKHIISWAENKFLVNDFKDLGFSETSNSVSELIL